MLKDVIYITLISSKMLLVSHVHQKRSETQVTLNNVYSKHAQTLKDTILRIMEYALSVLTSNRFQPKMQSVKKQSAKVTRNMSPKMHCAKTVPETILIRLGIRKEKVINVCLRNVNTYLGLQDNSSLVLHNY